MVALPKDPPTIDKLESAKIRRWEIALVCKLWFWLFALSWCTTTLDLCWCCKFVLQLIFALCTTTICILLALAQRFSYSRRDFELVWECLREILFFVLCICVYWSFVFCEMPLHHFRYLWVLFECVYTLLSLFYRVN